MSTNRSEDHYFRYGDITLLVDNVLFKLHRDILGTHSQYFENTLNTSEPGEDQANSDERPFVLAANICSAETFDVICEFLYPKAIGVSPTISIQEVEKWEAVLQATVLLQMQSLREYILANFKGDIEKDPASSAKLLGLAVRYSEAPNFLKLRCLNTLVFLRRAVSPAEIGFLGETATSQVTAIRDRVRVLTAASQTYWSTIHRHYLCMEGPNCQRLIYEGVFNNIINIHPLQDYYHTDSTIFDIAEDNRICFHCGPIRSELAKTMAKQELEDEIRRWGIGLGLLKSEI